ncbi:cysteine hydrolase [Candidatus Gracilibacteria bacterium]|nr:cysteine hydrolase [Candidatus Gracilibacteria bacterium]
MNKTALVLIDFQNVRTDEKSPYYVGDISDIIAKVNYLKDYAQKMGYKTIFTRHLESNGDFSQHEQNSEIITEISKNENDIIVKKNKINPFYKTDMDEQLKGIENVVVCGILTNLCVRSFVEGAYDREMNIVILKDCCKAFDKKSHEFTLEDLKKTREEIDILDLQGFLE